MFDLSEINSWKQNFGLLPIHLNPHNVNNKFVMLNGGSGDFCLDLSNNFDSAQHYFEITWSTNTKNFVLLEEENIKICNWIDKKVETISRQRVEGNLNTFYSYLISKSYKTENDIVPFVLDIFRKLRNVTFEKDKPLEALNLLFVLLVSIEEDYNKLDYNKWNFSQTEIPKHFEYFVELVKLGVKDLTPNLDLILRHTAGSLFQEAHREVIYFNPQMELFGGVSSKLITKFDAYSSIHYTPQYLARTIVENSLTKIDLNKPTLKIFDPACGSSEFLIEALKQLKNLNYLGKITVVGWDTSNSAVNTSKFLLQYEKRTQWNNANLEFDVKLVTDSLAEAWETDYDLILMNPPFVSWDLLKNKESRLTLVESLSTALKKGKPNQASAFFYKAAQCLNQNGVLGCVLPSSIFTSGLYEKLRNEVSDILSISMVARLGNFVFEDALTDVSFFIGQKPVSQFPSKIIWAKNEKGIVQEALRDLRKMEASNQQTVDEKSYSIYSPLVFPFFTDSWKVISLKENNFVKRLERYILDGKLTVISEIFNIKQGALLGTKNIFKISAHEYDLLPNEEQNYFRPVITSNSIKNGKLKISDYLWFPYDKTGLSVKSEEDLNNIKFGRENIIPNKNVLSARQGVTDYWALTRPRNWQFEKQIRLYSNRFGNSNSFAIDKSGDCVIEEGNAFIPKRDFKLDDYYFYLSCFSSGIFGKLLSVFSKQIMSGYDLGQAQIKNIPVPDIHKHEVRASDAYIRLVELGKELERGNDFVKQVIDDILYSYFYPNT